MTVAPGQAVRVWQDDDCRHWLWRLRYSPDGSHAMCPGCGRRRRFHRLRCRLSYSCDTCGHQISPTSGTLFEKSSTPLPLWFAAIGLLAGAEAGPDAGVSAGRSIGAGRLAAELGVSRSTAARMKRRIAGALQSAAGAASERRPLGVPLEVVVRVAAEARAAAPAWAPAPVAAARPPAPVAGGVQKPAVDRAGPPRPTRAAARRAGILVAACEVICEKGMAATRVAAIARTAGVSSASVHYYFGTKDDVLFAAVLWQNERETERRAAIVAAPMSATVKLVRFLNASMPPDGFTREEALVRFDLWGRAMREAAYKDVLRPLREEWRRQFAAILEQGLRSAEFRPPRVVRADA